VSFARVTLRATLVAGAAAMTALASRGSIADRVAARVVPAVGRMATRAPSLVREEPPPPPPLTTQPLPPPPNVPLAPPLPPSAAPKPSVAKSSAPTSAKTTAGPAHVSRAEVETAIGTKLGGASAKLARDSEGHPLGLELQGVGTAARFGVREGDILVAANGHPLRNAEEGFAALGAIFPDGGKRPTGPTHVVFTFKRGAAWYSVPVEVDAP
jgi:hypothetical protein